MKEYDLRISIMKRTDITPSDKLVLLGALLCVDWTSLAGHVSVDEMSALTGITTRQVQRSFRRLTVNGFISRESKYIKSKKRHRISSIQINGDILSSTPKINGDILSSTPKINGDILSSTPQINGDILSSTPQINGDILSSTPQINGDILSPLSITNNNNNNKSNENGDLKIDWDQFKHLSKSEFDNLPPEGQLAYRAKAIMCSSWGAWQYDEFLEEFNSTMETRQ